MILRFLIWASRPKSKSLAGHTCTLLQHHKQESHNVLACVKLALDVASLLNCYFISSIIFFHFWHIKRKKSTVSLAHIRDLRLIDHPSFSDWNLNFVSSFFLQSLLDEKSLASTKYRKALILFGSSLILLKTVWSNENCQICILVLSGILLMNKEKLM